MPHSTNEKKREWHKRRYADPAYRQKLSDYNKEYASRPETILRKRNRNLKAKFDLTLGQWDALFEGQEKCCAACGTDDPGTKNGWDTDHCHVTNRIRGILCHPCNVALGAVKDDPVILGRLIDYLHSTLDKQMPV